MLILLRQCLILIMRLQKKELVQKECMSQDVQNIILPLKRKIIFKLINNNIFRINMNIEFTRVEKYHDINVYFSKHAESNFYMTNNLIKGLENVKIKFKQFR